MKSVLGVQAIILGKLVLNDNLGYIACSLGITPSVVLS